MKRVLAVFALITALSGCAFGGDLIGLQVGSEKLSVSELNNELKMLASFRDEKNAKALDALTTTTWIRERARALVWLALAKKQQLTPTTGSGQEIYGEVDDILRSIGIEAPDLSKKEKATFSPIRKSFYRGYDALRSIVDSIGSAPANDSELEELCPKIIAGIFVDTKKNAQEIRSAVSDATSFANAAVESSTDETTAQSGGLLGCFGEGAFEDPKVETVAADLAIDTISEVHRGTNGYFILYAAEGSAQFVNSNLLITHRINEAADGIEFDLDRRYGSMSQLGINIDVTTGLTPILRSLPQ